MKRIVPWDTIDAGCNVLAQKISNTRKYDVIVGIGRGGLIPAITLSNYLDIPKVFNFGVKSYTETKTKGEYDVYQDLNREEGIKHLNNSNVLIVDDLSDTGDTFAYVMLSLAERFVPKHTSSAALYVKPNAKYIPDFYYKKLQSDPWIVFPWETEMVTLKIT